MNSKEQISKANKDYHTQLREYASTQIDEMFKQAMDELDRREKILEEKGASQKEINTLKDSRGDIENVKSRSIIE